MQNIVNLGSYTLPLQQNGTFCRSIAFSYDVGVTLYKGHYIFTKLLRVWGFRIHKAAQLAVEKNFNIHKVGRETDTVKNTNKHCGKMRNTEA